MGKVINRQTIEVRDRVHTPDYLEDPDWLVVECGALGIAKKLPVCESKYWKVVGEEVMSILHGLFR